MAVIGGFRSDLSITRKIDGNFGNVLFCFPKSRTNENGGKSILHQLKACTVPNILVTLSFRGKLQS